MANGRFSVPWKKDRGGQILKLTRPPRNPSGPRPGESVDGDVGGSGGGVDDF